jgi:nitrate reductase NapE component
MIQIATLVLGFPAGYFIRDKVRATCALFVVLAVVLIPQTISTKNDGHLEALYWIIQAATFVAAYGLVVWGHRIAIRRRARVA